MKYIKIVCMLIISIMIGASAVASVNAGKIDAGSIDVTINDNVYGTASPEINFPKSTTVTLKAEKMIGEENITYQVKDNVSIPINVELLKDNVYIDKHINVVGVLDRKKQPICSSQPIVVEGSLGGDGSGIVSDQMVNLSASYEITNETFENGESYKMIVLSMGGKVWPPTIPGKTDPIHFSGHSDTLVDLLVGENGLLKPMPIVEDILKTFLDAQLDVNLDLLVITGEAITLNVEYELAGDGPEGYELETSVAEGNGTIVKSPDQVIYQENTIVNLTATPDSGYIFNHWEGDVDDPNSATTSITMDSDKTVSAYFEESPVKIETKGGIASAKLTITNQRDYELSDIEYNITMEGGILGKISTQVNGTIDNITAEGNIVLNTPKVWFGLGKSTINLELIIPGEGVVEKKFSATHLGPIILA